MEMKFPRALQIFIFAGTFFVIFIARADPTNSLTWKNSIVSADIKNEQLWPLLQDIAHKTGWRIFVEPGSVRTISVKFSKLAVGEALHQLLGDLNFALVPQTNAPAQLYVFKTTMQNATRAVIVRAAPKHMPNELLVRVKPGTDIDALAKSLGAKIIGRDDKLGIYRLQFDDAAATDSALTQLKNDSDVLAVDYNYILDPPAVPQQVANAPLGPVSLKLNPSTPNNPCDPVIGLIDTPVQSLGSTLDPFLEKSISVTGDSAPANSTGPTHGTAMAETILRAVSQSANGSSSVKILPVDVYGASETTTSWNVALGIQAAVNNGATVLNMSLGGTSDSAIVDDLIQQAQAKGIIIFAAAGNEPVNTPTYPAAIPGVNAVTALGAPGQLASYANYGSFVAMALPGASVVYLGSQAYVVQGTSPATAFATGIAAGTKSVNCDGWTQIESTMQKNFPVPAGK
jgi:hypothetical protein